MSLYTLPNCPDFTVSPILRQTDVSFTNPKFFKYLKGNLSTPSWPGLIRLVNSTYKVRGDFVTTQQLLLFPRLDEWDGKRMLNAPVPPCREKPHVHSIQSALLTWAAHRKKSECVCLHRHKRGFVTLRHHRWMTSSVPLWDCRELGLEVCVCVLFCVRVRHSRSFFPWEKEQRHTSTATITDTLPGLNHIYSGKAKGVNTSIQNTNKHDFIHVAAAG